MYRKNVLIIENERMVFLDLKIIFTNLGHQVIFGNNLNLENIFKAFTTIDFIILDILSLKQNKGLLRFAIANYKPFQEVPIILTSSSLKSKVQFCLTKKINVVAELKKPYSSSQLLEIFNNTINENVSIKSPEILPLNAVQLLTI